MPNIIETESVTNVMDEICTQNIINDDTQFLDSGNPNLNEQMNESVSESNGSGAKLVDLKSMINHEKIEIDPNKTSEQVNGIINEAVKINEAILNDRNERKNGRSLEHEINNNNIDYNSNHNYTTFKKGNWFPYKTETELMANSNVETIRSSYANISSEKVPIQRITNTLNFQKNSDDSLQLSFAINSNTTEFSSTGPESSILSDIEDGYKGHVIEIRRKEETMKYEGDAKEDFIERQFGYLSAHLNNIPNVGSDQDKAGSIERCNIISSTMIADKLNDTFEKSYGGKKIINELTEIIESKRLDKLIKSKNETNYFIEIGKQSPLPNFHIGAYSKSKNQEEKWRKIGSSIESTKDDRNSQKFLNSSLTNIIQKSIEHNDSNSFSKINNNDGSKSYEEFENTKPIARSLSFHTTFASIFNHGGNKANIADLFGTTRSISYKSLHNTSKQFSSELSIGDIPSLQSIEVMRSILNNTSTIDTYNKSSIQKSEEHQELDESKRKIFDINENKLNAHTDKTFTVLKEAELKSWKYQGPPSINLSTWGERHSSLAKSIKACSYNTCKLPVVRSVEFKKNMFVNRKDSIANDTLDSLQSPRPSNDEFRMIQQNTTANPNYKDTTITLNQTANINQNLIIAPEKSPSVNPVQTLNVEHERHLVDQSELESITKNKNPAARAIFPKNIEKPIFMQFALRKTGLKEKILNECSSSKISTTKNNFQSSIIDKLNANHISTAQAKPTPMLKKSLFRPISMVDSRHELLNSIRNFKHDTLNRKCM